MMRKFAISLVAALALGILCASAPHAAEKGALLAALESEGVSVSVAGENLFLVRYEGHSATFDWAVHPGRPNPRIQVADYDGDGEKEAAFAFYMGGGTGVSYESLYIVKARDGKLTSYDYEAYSKDMEAVKNAVSFKAFKEGHGVFVEFAYGKDRLRVDVSKKYGKSLDPADITFECGNIVHFRLTDGGITLSSPFGIKISGTIITDYYGDVLAKVQFANGKFSFADIRLFTDDNRVKILGSGNSPQKTARAATRSGERQAIIGFDGLLLGGVFRGKWVSHKSKEFSPLRIQGGETYAVYGAKGLEGTGHGEILRNKDQEDELTLGVTIGGAELTRGMARLAISEGWNVSPRQAAALDTKNPAYNEIVRDYLARNGLPNATSNIVQIFRVDLDGDGADEVLICAQNIVGKNTEAATWEMDKPLSIGAGFPEGSEKGQYSLILLRKVIDGQAREIPVAQFIALKDGRPIDPEWVPPSLHKVYQFADLNGDGVMEVIIGEDYYEGCSYSVFEIQDDKAVKALTNGAGA